MHSVTSNAVARAFGGEWENLWTGSNNSFVKGIKTKMGKFLRIRFNNVFGGNKSNGEVILTITNTDYIPIISPCRFVFTIDTTSNTRMNASVDYDNDGRMKIYFQDRVSFSELVGVAGCYCDALVLVL